MAATSWTASSRRRPGPGWRSGTGAPSNEPRRRSRSSTTRRSSTIPARIRPRSPTTASSTCATSPGGRPASPSSSTGACSRRGRTHRRRVVQGSAVLMAYLHDIGMVAATPAGRRVHAQFAAHTALGEGFDDLAEELWRDDVVGLRARIEADAHRRRGDPRRPRHARGAGAQPLPQQERRARPPARRPGGAPRRHAAEGRSPPWISRWRHRGRRCGRPGFDGSSPAAVAGALPRRRHAGVRLDGGSASGRPPVRRRRGRRHPRAAGCRRPAPARHDAAHERRVRDLRRSAQWTCRHGHAQCRLAASAR